MSATPTSTFHGLFKWFHHLTEKSGYMIMKKRFSNDFKSSLQAYWDSFEELQTQITLWESLSLSPREKKDLQILKFEVKYLWGELVALLGGSQSGGKKKRASSKKKRRSSKKA